MKIIVGTIHELSLQEFSGYAHLITTRGLFWLSSLQRQLATRLTQLSDRLRGKQLLKNFHEPTNNGLKNTKKYTISRQQFFNG
ncbi:hypothetical protein PN451_10415 [Dolichospermum planctonicum CS-1226]|uniref:Transposase n=1 Tax=Dolichospermum planctonicum CS-1226 TaxID=3021751 RepID=A0ABT5AG15_9CYAN|nr:hypothetical protein [Dolichospermum planctonicum]MDB9536236.1 hypothetical protein [Dolichospermum planctonicum CS-1226]